MINRSYLFLVLVLIFAPWYVNCINQFNAESSRILDENDQVSGSNLLSTFAERRDLIGKRQIYKRIQIPFKWGKRSSSLRDFRDLCTDFFMVLIGQNKNEINKWQEQQDIKIIYTDCFKHMVKPLLNSETSQIQVEPDFDSESNSKQFKPISIEREFQNADAENDNEVSYVGNGKGILLKRQNIPFRWG